MKLSARQKEILALAIELCDRRQLAVALDMGYVTLDGHLNTIGHRLGLPSHRVKFCHVPLGEKFIYQGTTYQRVDRATDRFGGYNAQDGDGHRVLVLYHTIVERVDDE